jgi:hypothetical protein
MYINTIIIKKKKKRKKKKKYTINIKKKIIL